MNTSTVCSRFHRAVELVGGRWNGPILQAALAGRHRYADIKSAVPGLSDTMLSQRLRELEAEGLLERCVVPSSPVRVEYYPTDKGRALDPVLRAVAAWADQWIEPVDDLAGEAAAGR
ncbi:MAG TPA: winged helix-turn-helix transcriptional regulator [Chloroflexota bacterium]